MQAASASADAAGASQPPPVIAVLLGRSSSPGFLGAAVKAQQDLLCGGAHDVIAKCGRDADLGVAISMAAVRITEKHKQHSDFKRELRRQLQIARGEQDPTLGMFWQSVHHVFDYFPPMDAELTQDPCEGDEVGPLRLGRKLGQGGFGQVFSATNLETGEPEAVKMVAKAPLRDLAKVGLVWRECKVNRRLKEHENIAQCYGCLHGPSHIFIRMEMAGQQNLYTVVKNNPAGMALESARHCQAQIASGLSHLHIAGVAHRDLKPENIGIVEDPRIVVKLLDFGSAAPLDKRVCDMAGTMPFMAPEVLAAGDEEPYEPSGCDVWSIAVVLLEMLCGPDKMGRMLKWGRKHPPCPKRADEIDAFFTEPAALRGALETDLGPVDDSLFALLDSMLQLDSSRRLSAQEVADDAWLQSVEQHRDA